MIYSLKGILTYKEPAFAVVECGGVGYKCFVSFQTFSVLCEVGDEIKLLTHMSVKEDAMDLFGFATSEEMECFKMLTTVSGVGAKVGLSILSELKPQSVSLAIVGGDSKAFTRCSGVGPKLASRIVLELKDKFKGANLGLAEAFSSKSSGDINLTSATGEAIAALVALGYSQGEAAGAVSSMDKNLSAQDMIKASLKALAKKI